MKTLKYILPTILLAFLLNSCEDEVPNAYEPDFFIEAYLMVDEPLQNIKVMKTLPPLGKLTYEDAFIYDATVTIYEGDTPLQLVTEPTGTAGYYYDDPEFRVKPETEYRLEIVMSDGHTVTGHTTTPGRSKMTDPVRDIYYYPKDTVKLPPSDSISWQYVPGHLIYAISVRCLDTLGYGQYLDPPTDEENERVVTTFQDDDEDFKNLNSWAFLPGNNTPVVWGIFKYHGLQEVTVYVMDENFTEWMFQYIANGWHDYHLTSVEGGIGCFGSAYAMRDTSFLMKNGY